MSEGLQEGAWKGRRVFILGGGPSLRGIDTMVLAGRGEITLGLNMAFLHNPTATLIYDKRCMERVSMEESWKNYRGFKVWLNYEDQGMPLDSFPQTRQLHEYVTNPYTRRWPKAMSEGLYRGNNAGTAGICLADVLGAETIYLLGYDMSVEAGKPANWHSLYPEEWQAKQSTIKAYREDIERIKGSVRARVINVTPGSALNVFPKDTLGHVLEMKEPCQK